MTPEELGYTIFGIQPAEIFQSSLRQPFLDAAEIAGRRKRRRGCAASQSFQEEIAVLQLISDSESCSAASRCLSVRRDSAPSTLTTKPTNHEPAPPSSIEDPPAPLHPPAFLSPEIL